MLRSVAAVFAALRPVSWRSTRSSGDLARVQFWCVFAGFVTLGGHVGVWAVLLADLVAAHTIPAGLLGQILAATSVAGAISSYAGGRIGDRLGRRLLLVIALAGTGAVFIALANAGSREAVIAIFLLMGLTGGFFDLSLNSLGGDYELAYGRIVMPTLHAGFSAGAASTALLTGLALLAGARYTTLYVVAGGVLLAMAVLALVAPLPTHQVGPEPAVADDPAPVQSRLWSRGLIVAMAMVGLIFMQDAAIEGFAGVYLQQALQGGPLLVGGGIAITHAAVLIGRLLSARSVRRFGERAVLTTAGVGAALGLGLIVLANSPVGAVLGFLLVGVSVAPVAPLAFSLAGRSAPGRVGQAMSAVSIVAYGAFIVGPILAGSLADTASLRVALAPFVATSLLMAAVAALGLPRLATKV